LLFGLFSLGSVHQSTIAVCVLPKYSVYGVVIAVCDLLLLFAVALKGWELLTRLERVKNEQRETQRSSLEAHKYKAP
jgi:hypothetical protein